ncbi:stellacyanin-like [Cannabis sativa]|uniref:Phytocyanin domain-containing protein n=1 Tax=Cannabis sativa TaxID=3483 RepID=A0A803Q9P9_CANSA|nr:stellacyanin-like [Cannabis sativa]
MDGLMVRMMNKKQMKMGMFVVVMVGLLKVAAADTYTVGGDMGWTNPLFGEAAYSAWAKSNRFDVGDVIVFKWRGSNHNVAEVSKADYDSCNIRNPINGTIYKTSPVNIPLTSNNTTRYFISTIADDCTNFGQKVTISMDNQWLDDDHHNSAPSFPLNNIFLTPFFAFFLNILLLFFSP